MLWMRWEGERELWGQLEAFKKWERDNKLCDRYYWEIVIWQATSLDGDLHSLSQGNKLELSDYTYFHK